MDVPVCKKEKPHIDITCLYGVLLVFLFDVSFDNISLAIKFRVGKCHSFVIQFAVELVLFGVKVDIESLDMIIRVKSLMILARNVVAVVTGVFLSEWSFFASVERGKVYRLHNSSPFSFIRWIPWVHYITGCEICQLKVEDFGLAAYGDIPVCIILYHIHINISLPYLCIDLEHSSKYQLDIPFPYLLAIDLFLYNKIISLCPK